MKRTSREIIRMNNFLKFIAKDYNGLLEEEIKNLQAAVDEIEVIEDEPNEIVKAFEAGYSNGFMQKFNDGDDYYNKTFKK